MGRKAGIKRSLEQNENQIFALQKKLRDAETRAEEAETRAEEAEKRAEEAERARLRSDFINDLKDILERDSLMLAIDRADFDGKGSSDVSTGSGTGLFISDNESKATSLTGGIQMSKFCRKQVCGTSDQMNVALLPLSEDELLEPLKQICLEMEIDYADLVLDELKIIRKIRSVLHYLVQKCKASMSEQVVQMLFSLYVAGLFEKLRLEQFSVKSITGQHLEANILVKKNGKIVSRKLHGKADVGILYTTDSDYKTEKQQILHENSIIVEMKYTKLGGSCTEVASCTSQQLAQMLAICKMRTCSDSSTIVRSILSDFSRIRLAVGIKEASNLSYFISTLSSDPLFLLGGIVWMQSQDIKEVISNLRTLRNVEDYDYGSEDGERFDEGGESFDEASDTDNDEVGGNPEQYGDKSLSSEFRAANTRFGSENETAHTMNSVISLNKIYPKGSGISMGDDDQMEQLHELRDSWLNEWDSARLGQVYLSAQNLHAKTR